MEEYFQLISQSIIKGPYVLSETARVRLVALMIRAYTHLSKESQKELTICTSDVAVEYH